MEFKKSEILDAENMWRCPSCKKDVQATIKMEIYRPPPILVISLKRFKSGVRRYGMFSGSFSSAAG